MNENKNTTLPKLIEYNESGTWREIYSCKCQHLKKKKDLK